VRDAFLERLGYAPAARAAASTIIDRRFVMEGVSFER